MFKSNKKQKYSNSYDTLIAQGTEISGNIVVSGSLHIDGKIEGIVTVKADNQHAVVRLSEVGEVRGDISAPHVIINGKVYGNVYASEHVELAPKASIEGNVYYSLIEMAMGAEVNGKLVHEKTAPPDRNESVTEIVPDPGKDNRDQDGNH